MYTHFGHGYIDADDGTLSPRFVELMRRLSRKDGWFVPVSTLLDFLRAQHGVTDLEPQQRRHLETRWLWEKLFRGTS